MERNSYTNLVWGLDGSRYYFDEITRNNWFEKHFEDSAEKIREFTKQAIDKAFEKEKIKMRKDQKIIITTDGKTTTARMFDGKELIKSAEAKCHPDDEFDFETGAKVAFDRLVEREEKVKPKELLKNGVFGKTADNDWFVVVGDSVIYKRGMFDIVEEFSEDLDDIVALIAAKSFNEARYALKNNSQQVIWRNPKWMK